MQTLPITAFIAASIFFYWVLVPSGLRKYFLLLCSVSFIAYINPAYALYYLLLVGFVSLAAAIFPGRSFSPRNKKYVLRVVVTALVLNLCAYKCYAAFLCSARGPVMESMIGAGLSVPRMLFPVGLSFMTFRLIHFCVESYRGNIKRTSYADTALYAMFFPTFLAGPVERFPAFGDQTSAPGRITLSCFNYGIWRVSKGMIKKFIIADTMYMFIMPVLMAPEPHTRLQVVLAVYGAAIWLYMDFSGYADMAIGVSRLFGYRIMENFDRPFLKNNIALYWRSWHISVYSWIRDYFFFPFFVHKGTKIKVYAGIFMTMMVFMLWHAPTFNFFIAGIYNGTGLVAWKMFQELKGKWPALADLTGHKCMGPVGVLATFAYVAFGIGLTFIDTGSSGIGKLLEKIFTG